MERLQLYVPRLEDLWFRRQMMADPATMAYDAGYDVAFGGYHRDTGCIDFPETAWADWYGKWIVNEPQRFYAYIRRCDDGQWLGEVCLHRAAEGDWWDMGVLLYAPFRGKGYGAPALRLLLDYGFRKMNIPCIHNEFELARTEAACIHRQVGFREAGVQNGIMGWQITREKYLRKRP